MKMSFFSTGLLIALLSSSLQAEILTFGVVPQQSATTLANHWTPLMTYLSEKTGYEVRFATAQDIPTFEQRLRDGEYDIAYMNPYHYTVFAQVPGYRAIAKQQNKSIKGIVVVAKDSPIQSLTDLQGETLAFPSPAAFAASVLPRAKMEQDGIEFTPQYVSSHDSVYLTVSRGLFPAGGGVVRTFNTTPSEIRENLRVLWTTPGYTSHAIAVHPDISNELADQLQQAMVGMNDDADAQPLLSNIGFSGMESATDANWDDVRELNIRLLDDLLK